MHWRIVDDILYHLVGFHCTSDTNFADESVSSNTANRENTST